MQSKTDDEFLLSARVAGMRIGIVWFASAIEDRKGFSKLVYVLPESERNANNFTREEESYANVVDLTKDEKQIYAQFHRNTRYEINIANRYSFRIGYNENYGEAASLMNDFFARKRMRFPSRISEKELKQGNHLLTEGWIENELVHVSYMLLHKALATQIITCSRKLEKEQSRASILARHAHFEAMKRLKAEGFKRYDFGSVDRSGGSSISAFKLSFGGEIVPLPAYFKVYNPLLRLRASLSMGQK